MEKKKKSGIDLGQMIRKLLKHKWLIFCTMIVTGGIYAWLICCVPRYYTCEVMLAPEFDNATSASGLASLANSFGVNLGSGMDNDAISPSLYPDLMESKDFLVSLFPIKVKTVDGKIETDYYTYLAKHQEKPWWKIMSNNAKNSLKKIFREKPKKKQKHTTNEVNPFQLCEEDYKMAENIQGKITCSVDRRNYVITIRVQDQDPLISATIADSVRCRLQNFITEYRTRKARVDVDYYSKLHKEAKENYDKATNAYSIYADTHHDMIMQTYISQRDELENEMQTKFAVYTQISQQLEAAKAKLQQCTPAFTTLKCASVPIKPTGPKRVMFVLGMLIMTFFVLAVLIIKGKAIRNALKDNPNDKPIGNNSTPHNNVVIIGDNTAN